jgi:uncharacterized membrane protein
MVSESTTGNPPSAPKSGRRWVTVALFVSLVANVFLIGLCGGRIFHGHGWFDRQPQFARTMGPWAGRALDHLIDGLSDADRQIVQDSVSSHADELQKLTQAVREQRQVVARLLKAENFDRKAVDDAFTELRVRSDAMQTALQGAIADAVAKLSPAARKELED